MPRFFLPCSHTDENSEIVLTGSDAHHLSGPLRARVADEVVVCDAAGRDYHCRIRALGRGEVLLTVLRTEPSIGEPGCRITLYQCLPKADKMEQIIQKSVELGAVRIVPVLSSRSVSRPDGASAEKKWRRWNDIALEASKQSERGIVVPVSSLMPFEQALPLFARADAALLLYERDRGAGLPARLSPAATVSVLVGPEGGLDRQEVELAEATGAMPVWLGPRILRTETAGPAALAVIQYITGNFGPALAEPQAAIPSPPI